MNSDYGLSTDFVNQGRTPMPSRPATSYAVEDDGQIKVVQYMKPTFCNKVRAKASKIICTTILVGISIGLFVAVGYFFYILVGGG